jgi:hypothetical protein
VNFQILQFVVGVGVSIIHRFRRRGLIILVDLAFRPTSRVISHLEKLQAAIVA